MMDVLCLEQQIVIIRRRLLMGFWVFMLIMDLLIPFTMICFGRYFMKKAPKEINAVLIGSIFSTEIALKKNFGKNGKRR